MLLICWVISLDVSRSSSRGGEKWKTIRKQSRVCLAQTWLSRFDRIYTRMTGSTGEEFITAVTLLNSDKWRPGAGGKSSAGLYERGQRRSRRMASWEAWMNDSGGVRRDQMETYRGGRAAEALPSRDNTRGAPVTRREPNTGWQKLMVQDIKMLQVGQAPETNKPTPI